MKGFILVPVILFIAATVFSQQKKPVEKEVEEKPVPGNEFSSQEGTFTDSRDEQEYKWVRIGGQIWMAENLNTGLLVNDEKDQKNNGILEKYCIESDSNNCEIFGGFYTWNEMMQYSYKNDNQGICPHGWHIPSNEEWNELEFFVENDIDKNLKYFQRYGWRGSFSGKRLKATKLWLNSSFNTDDFNFSVIPNRCPSGGFPSGYGYKKIGRGAFFWTSSIYEERTNNFATIRRFNHKKDGISREGWPKDQLLNVRCIKNN